MNLADFPESNIKIAEHQEEYRTVNAFYDKNKGSIVYKIQLSMDERKKVVESGEIWVEQLTGGRPMQPMYFTADKNEVIDVKE